MSDREWAKREGLLSFAGYPLLVGDGVVGVAAAFSRETLTQSTMMALSSIATRVARDVETDLADIPAVKCHLGDLNQVFLNLLVNAAHAIAGWGTRAD